MDLDHRPGLVFVSRRPPLPLANGSRIRTHRLVTGLSEDFRTTFVTFDHHPTSHDGACDPSELATALPGIEVVQIPGCGPGRRISQARSLMGRRSWTYGRYDLPGLGATLRDIVARQRAKIVHFDDVGAALHGPIPGVLNAYASHNVEYDILGQTQRSARGIRKPFAAIEYRKVRREEQAIWRSMDLTFAVSELNADTMRSCDARRVGLCPNGTDQVDQPPLCSLIPGEPLRLVFVGSGGYLPYQQGIAWFAREVMSQFPQHLLRLDIVGPPPPRPETLPNIHYHGIVADLMPFYANCHAAIVPVFEGSGTRLKVIEAAAYGRPVVSTPLGAEGLPVMPGTDYDAATNAAEFTAALRALRKDYESGGSGVQRQISNARAAIEPLLWPHIVQQLRTTYLESIVDQ